LATACIPCPPNSITLRAASTTRGECICEPGYFDANASVAVDAALLAVTSARESRAGPVSMTAAVVQCTVCPVGITDCDRGSTLEALPLRKGYYRLDANSLDVRVCPDAQVNCSTTFGTAACESASACQGGAGDPCANNLTGVYCLLCDRSDLAAPVYYKRSTSNEVARCVDCSDTLASTAFVVLGILSAVILVILLMRLLKRNLPEKWIARLSYLNAQFTLFDKGKICFCFYQIVTQVSTVNDVSMPNEVTLLIERLSVVVTLGLPDIAITPLECVGLGGYRPRLLFWMIAPVAVDIVIVLCVLLLLTWKGRCCAPRTRRTPGTAAVATRRGSSLSRWLARQSLGAPAALPPPPTASVANKAEQKTLVHKALPAVLVSLFVLYPKVTLVAFEGFPCYEFVVSSTETRHFLRADVGIDCDSDEWEQVALLAWAAIVLYPIGMWVATAVMLRTASHSIANGKKTAFSSAISFVYQEYNVTTYWWELMEMLRKFLLVGVMVLVEPGTLLQISIGTIFCAVYLLIQLQARPYLSRADGFLADVSSFSLLMVYFCCTIYKFGMLTGSDDLQLSLEQRQKYTIPGTAFSAILFLSVLGSLFFAGVLVAVQTAFEMKRVLSPTWGANLPTCEWHMKPGQEFSCFLSHYKAEAGAEARYLKDSLDKMLSCPAYLDSSTLADLRELFRSGVRQSEVLVLLLSQGVLTRPWCLLEIREAVRLQKPIVLLELKGPGQSFSFDAAFELMSDLESNLPPWAVDELCAHLKEEPLSELQDTLRKALETGRAAGVPHFNINGCGPHGSNRRSLSCAELLCAYAVAQDRQPARGGAGGPCRKVSGGHWAHRRMEGRKLVRGQSCFGEATNERPRKNERQES
jgi:hypothetical protein